MTVESWMALGVGASQVHLSVPKVILWSWRTHNLRCREREQERIMIGLALAMILEALKPEDKSHFWAFERAMKSSKF